jgi:hypothetical protein
MDTQEKGVFFSLEEQEYLAVCQVANAQDKTLGQALSLLVLKGWEALEAEAVDTEECLKHNKYLCTQVDHLSNLVYALDETMNELRITVATGERLDDLLEVTGQEGE